jgi:hypothetical protein
MCKTHIALHSCLHLAAHTITPCRLFLKHHCRSDAAALETFSPTCRNASASEERLEGRCLECYRAARKRERERRERDGEKVFVIR